MNNVELIQAVRIQLLLTHENLGKWNKEKIDDQLRKIDETLSNFLELNKNECENKTVAWLKEIGEITSIVQINKHLLKHCNEYKDNNDEWIASMQNLIFIYKVCWGDKLIDWELMFNRLVNFRNKHKDQPSGDYYELGKDVDSKW
jgi:uncharacterized protein YacL (UPF0231 family)